MLYAAVLLVVGASVAVPSALVLQSNRQTGPQVSREPPVAIAVAGAGQEAGAASAHTTGPAHADPSAVASSPPSSSAPSERNERDLAANVAANLGAVADAGAKIPASAGASDAGGGASDAGPSADPDGPGFLTISSSPPARVSERGRVLCTTTPCAKLKLPAGAHTITLENKEDATKTVITVKITSGETTTRRVTLKQ